MDTSDLHDLIDQLPTELQKEVFDFASFLLTKKGTSSKKPRILNLHEGQVWMSEDFDEPLPDSFWLGE